MKILCGHIFVDKNLYVIARSVADVRVDYDIFVYICISIGIHGSIKSVALTTRTINNQFSFNILFTHLCQHLSIHDCSSTWIGRCAKGIGKIILIFEFCANLINYWFVEMTLKKIPSKVMKILSFNLKFIWFHHYCIDFMIQ